MISKVSQKFSPLTTNVTKRNLASSLPLKKMKSKLLKEHRKNCFAIKAKRSGEWDTEWSEYVKESYFGDKSGRRRNGHNIWILFNCNDPSCKAQKIVSGLEAVRI